MSKASRPLADLADLAEQATARAVLDSLKVKLDGTAATAETVRRKRRNLVNAANYAVDLGELRENPITAARWQKPKASNQVDRRAVANLQQARNLLQRKGSVVPSSTCYGVWREAGSPRSRRPSLPRRSSRPYDLRHLALSTWLSAGVDPTEVAERAGNSVEVLLTHYATCLDGRQDVANRRIEDLLREYE
ncbi:MULTISPECIES: hypothetical protein [unclassified Streptomyces]|uniref:hypothetical protein n=1 Tax=unclassified Streptomyces TaxID=2593676 RepID=UPI003803BC7C